ncbi:MAG: acylphosphatase [Burkholderiales bacterium]|jgi:acylphosphatase|nr:acylphosphatase [Burkholderiales bacterium]
MRAIHLTIRGRVQGVGYRDTLRSAARRNGATGWVRNRGDGTVEAVLQGDDAALDALRRWVRRGPPLAVVERVEERPASTEETALIDGSIRRLPTV